MSCLLKIFFREMDIYSCFFHKKFVKLLQNTKYRIEYHPDLNILLFFPPVDFDCIIGGQIHDIHLSWNRQYKDVVTKPMDIILAVGMNNIPSCRDSAKNIVLQIKSLLKSIKRHSKKNNHDVPNRYSFHSLLK